MNFQEIADTLSKTQLRNIVLEKMEIGELMDLQRGAENELQRRQCDVAKTIKEQISQLIRLAENYNLRIRHLGGAGPLRVEDITITRQ